MTTPVIGTRYGSLHYIESDPVIGRSLQEYGEWAQHEIDVLQKLIEPDRNVIDAGAFIGTHTIAFSRILYPAGNVFAFEPRREIFAILEKNIENNNLPNVTAYNIGLGRQNSSVLLSSLDLQDSKNFGGLSLNSDCSDRINTYEAIVRSIDELQLDNIGLIKLDVEGMEVEILAGASYTINRDRPILACECNSAEIGAGILRFACQNDYKSYAYLAEAYNADNYNGNEENFFGGAKELSLILLPGELTGETAKSIGLIRISNIDDLILVLLHKPQYPYEVLQSTAPAKVMGLGYPSPGSEDLRARLSDALGMQSSSQEELSTLCARYDALSEQCQILGKKNQSLTEETAKLQHQAQLLQCEISNLTGSSSWRITRPLRWLRMKLPWK